MSLKTRGFVSIKQRNNHFVLHGHDFGVGTSIEYEEAADTFLTEPLRSGVHEHVRSRGDLLRYDSGTDAFGVLDSGGVIRTFFKPVPCSSLSGKVRVAAKRAGLCHGCANNMLYFKQECKRW